MPHSQPTALQQTVCKFHLDPQYHISHWGSTVLGDSTLCNAWCDPVRRWEDHAHNVVCSPSGSSDFVGALKPTPGGEHVTIFWQSGKRGGGQTCHESRPPFGSKHAQWGSCLDSELTSLRPSYPVCSRKAVVTWVLLLVGWGVVYCLYMHKVSSKYSRRPGKHTIVEKLDHTR